MTCASAPCTFAAEHEVSLRMPRLEGSGDGEDERPTLYFGAHFAETGFQLAGERQGSDIDTAYRELTVFATAGGDDGTASARPTLVLPTTERFDPDHVRASEDGRLLLFMVKAETNEEALFVDGVDGTEVARLPLADVSFADDALQLANAPPILRAAIARVVAPPAWQRQLWPEHAHRVLEARVIVDDFMRAADFSDADPAALADLRALLAAESTTVPATALAGDWRIRTINVSDLGVFAYPFFRARIGETDQGLVLSKTTGSQRRQGHLYPRDAAGSSYVFLGALTMNDTPLGYYSGDPSVSGRSPSETDSAGVLSPLAGDRLLVILDAEWGAGFEVYLLERDGGN